MAQEVLVFESRAISPRRAGIVCGWIAPSKAWPMLISVHIKRFRTNAFLNGFPHSNLFCQGHLHLDQARQGRSKLLGGLGAMGIALRPGIGWAAAPLLKATLMADSIGPLVKSYITLVFDDFKTGLCFIRFGVEPNVSASDHTIEL